MRVFLTGAAGFIGQVTITELLDNGHQVLGLARSDKSAEIISKLGAQVQRGDLEDLESLKEGAKASDGIIHLAFVHDSDMTKYPNCCAIDRAAITAMGEAIAGTGKPLIIATGTLSLPSGTLATEEMDPQPDAPLALRAQSETLLSTLAKEKGFRGSIVRLSPSVHGPNDALLVPMLIEAARKNGAVYYAGEGSRWPSIHRVDAAAVLRLALEKGRTGAKYHAVAEMVTTKDMLELIGQKLQIPLRNVSVEEAHAKVDFLAHLLLIDNYVSSEITKKELGWLPRQPGLLADMEAVYF